MVDTKYDSTLFIVTVQCLIVHYIIVACRGMAKYRLLLMQCFD